MWKMNICTYTLAHKHIHMHIHTAGVPAIVCNRIFRYPPNTSMVSVSQPGARTFAMPKSAILTCEYVCAWWIQRMDIVCACVCTHWLYGCHIWRRIELCMHIYVHLRTYICIYSPDWTVSLPLDTSIQTILYVYLVAIVTHSYTIAYLIARRVSLSKQAHKPIQFANLRAIVAST